MTASAVQPEPTAIAAQYETLRMAALGEPLPAEARSGLILFLRRGMWGWARALVAAGAPAQPIRTPSFTSTAPHQSRAVIQLFAAMAMNANHRSL
jgi:hypothetical protein